MIGILGPRDSVTLAQQVALELGRSTDLIGLAYQDVDEAVGLAHSLELMCEVLLFTGVVPFERARRAGTWRCELDVIQHSQADLYRMIGLVLEQTEGKFPRVSIDSLDLDTVSCVFNDMGLPVPSVVIPALDEAGEFVFEDVEGIARAHLTAIENGEVDAALTCRAGVHQLLMAAGVTAWRVDHARVTIIDALRRAWLASEVKKTKRNSIAVVLVGSALSGSKIPAKTAPVLGVVEQSVTSHARRMGSRVAMDEGRYMLTTTQAAIEEMLDRYRNGQKSLIDLVKNPPPGVTMTLGVGFGGTFATALDSSEKAFRVSANSGDPAIVREDGTVTSLAADSPTAVSLQETSDAILQLAAETGLGPLSLRRLVSALGRTDHKAVTAQQLAEFYGVKPRSARRMLTLLVAARFAREAGVRGAAGAGRPHVVYDVDLPALSQIMATSSGRSGRASTGTTA